MKQKFIIKHSCKYSKHKNFKMVKKELFDKKDINVECKLNKNFNKWVPIKDILL